MARRAVKESRYYNILKPAKTAQVRVIPLKEAKERLIADLREAGKLA